ncbi:hypothetical protein FEZ60_28580 [Rhodococcus sp. MS16]|uniref:hypothetical protein n=1 Tax=unclassified Rhodococcus (in: high G+C Gram-positive bacteria) TaxID=192944 RepID=UPI0012096815|nr:MULTISPECIES: hypothetical protein [unclassified Rhodococcus (in: high G+C Gram-positive bacteria)]NRI69485.1 hypothetical protein [Rhodococcus sp. MS16]RZL22558.1 MAG: hypothetical protein EOP31_23975 [Rhodococcus sp. (in: high G+C Gram-positive bacteria)]
MSLSQFDAINAAMDSQLAEFRMRRSAAERDYQQRCAQFGELSTGVKEFGRLPFEQGAFLRSASASMPGDTAMPGDMAMPGDTAKSGQPVRDSSVDYRETAWLRRASD